MKEHTIPEKTVVQIALIGEGLIVAVSVLLVYWRQINLSITFSIATVSSGVLATVPLLIINFLILEKLARSQKFAVYRKFKEEIIRPLCSNLSPSSIFIVALASGFAEELFFRGVLNTELFQFMSQGLAITVSSLLFAYVHFIGLLKTYWPLVIFYFIFGAYFSYLALYTDNLLPCMLTHGVYNFIAMWYVRYVDQDNARANDRFTT
ncbi:CPBP family intramembrane metalloprotease [Oligoflexia bacterium]|nr:CPBP family intramembrane metalloprotease [Oligoflexia bacterium]